MADTELLNNCRLCFQQSQQSWKVYFSKWETLAKEEKVDSCSLWEDTKKQIKPPRKQKKRVSTSRKIRNKSMIALNKKKSKRSCLMYKRELKKSHRKKLVRKSKIEIMRKTENKANLESEMLNIEYSEPDLKAIFIEILSENVGNNEIFTVLSRMFSKNIDSLGSFSFGSTIMERNELTSDFVNNENSEISQLNKISRRSPNNKTELKCDPCKSVRFPNSSRAGISDFQQSDYFELRERHESGNQNLNVRRNYFETNSGLAFKNDEYGFVVNRYGIKKDFTERQVSLTNTQLNKKIMLNENEITYICTEASAKSQMIDHQKQRYSCAEKETNSSFFKKFIPDGSNSHFSACYNTAPLCFTDSLKRNSEKFKICERLVFESNVTKSSFSKNVVFEMKNNDPSFIPNTEKFIIENKPRKSKRKRSSSLFDFSDDSDDDEKDGKTKNPSRFLKIYCTPKRCKQSIKKETGNFHKPAADDSDGENFKILDRIKINKN